MTQLPIDQSIPRFAANEERVDIFVNDPLSTGYYETNETVPRQVKTLPSLATEIAESGLLRSDVMDTGNTAKGDALLGVKQPFAGSVARTQHDKNAENISVRDFGAVGDGVTDDTLALITAFANITDGSTLIINPGVYKITGSTTIECNKNINIFADGAIFDATQSTANPIIKLGSNLYQGWELLSAPVTAGASSITVSAPMAASLNAGDIIRITSDTYYGGDGALWNNARAYYYKGELVKVLSVSGTTVNLVNAIYDNYTTAHVICKLDAKKIAISGLEIKCNSNTIALYVESCSSFNANDIKISGSRYACLNIKQCFSFNVNNCEMFDFMEGTLGTNYGIIVNSSQNGTISKCKIYGGRHAIAIGGNEPSRAIIMNGNVLDGAYTSTVGCVDTHGNSEHVILDSNIITGGISFAGINFNITNNIIHVPISHVSIQGISIRPEGFMLNSYINITGNTIINKNAYYPIWIFHNYPYAYNYDCILIANNIIESTATAISIRTTVADVVGKKILINGNIIKNSSKGIALEGVSTKQLTFENIVISNNISTSTEHPIFLYFVVSNVVTISNNETTSTGVNSHTIETESSTIDRIDFINNKTKNVNVNYYPVTLTATSYLSFLNNHLSNHSCNGGIKLNAAEIFISGNKRTSCNGSISITGKYFSEISPTGLVKTYGSTAPSSGNWNVGDRCVNTTPAIGQPKSWVCTVAGSPGTWVSEGNL